MKPQKWPSKNKLAFQTLTAKVYEKIALALSRSANLKTILGHILQYMNELFHSEAASIILKDTVRKRIFFFAARGKKSKAITKYHLNPGEGICGWVISKNHPLLSNKPYKDPRFKKEIDTEINYKTKSIVCVPLRARNTTIGAMEIINKRYSDGRFTKQDLRTLNAIASQIAILINNNWLSRQAIDRMKALSSLITVSEAVSSSLDLPSVLNTVMEQVKKVMKTAGSSLMLRDRDTGNLIFSAVTGAKKEKMKNIIIPRGKGIAGWIAEHNRPCIVNDVSSDPRFYQNADEKSSFVTKQIIGVPMNLKDDVIGVVEAVNKLDGSSFGSGDLSLFSAMARLSAVAIQNARYYGELRELFLSSIRTLSKAIETKDPYTQGHSERVTLYSLMIANEMGLPEKIIEDVQLAGILHDIGKIGIDENILRKPERLTPEEFAEVKKHPQAGEEIMKKHQVSGSDSAWDQESSRTVRWYGISGWPERQ